MRRLCCLSTAREAQRARLRAASQGHISSSRRRRYAAIKIGEWRPYAASAKKVADTKWAISSYISHGKFPAMLDGTRYGPLSSVIRPATLPSERERASHVWRPPRRRALAGRQLVGLVNAAGDTTAACARTSAPGFSHGHAAKLHAAAQHWLTARVSLSRS